MLTTTKTMANPIIEPIDWWARVLSGVSLAVAAMLGVVVKSYLKYRTDNKQIDATHIESEAQRQERRIDRLEQTQTTFLTAKAQQDELILTLRTQVSQLTVQNTSLDDFINKLKKQNEEQEIHINQLILQNNGLIALLVKNGIHIEEELKVERKWTVEDV